MNAWVAAVSPRAARAAQRSEHRASGCGWCGSENKANGLTNTSNAPPQSGPFCCKRTHSPAKRNGKHVASSAGKGGKSWEKAGVADLECGGGRRLRRGAHNRSEEAAGAHLAVCAPNSGRQRARTANAPSLIPWLVRWQLSCDIQLARSRGVKNAPFCDPRRASSADPVRVDSPQG